MAPAFYPCPYLYSFSLEAPSSEDFSILILTTFIKTGCPQISEGNSIGYVLFFPFFVACRLFL